MLAYQQTRHHNTRLNSEYCFFPQSALTPRKFSIHPTFGHPLLLEEGFAPSGSDEAEPRDGPSRCKLNHGAVSALETVLGQKQIIYIKYSSHL